MNITTIHPNFRVSTQLNVDLSAAQWGLYTDRFSRPVIEKVANYLNQRIMREFNRGETQDNVRFSFNALAKDFAIYGATDTQVKETLNLILAKAYPNLDAMKEYQLSKKIDKV